LIDANSLTVGLSTSRRRGYADLGKKVEAALRSVDDESRHVVELVKLMEAYAYRCNLKFSEKKQDEEWNDHLMYLINFSKSFEEKNCVGEIINSNAEELINIDISIKTFNHVCLTFDEKDKAYRNLELIRRFIDVVAVSDHGRDALYDAMNNLCCELYKCNSDTDLFFEFLGEMSLVLKGIGEESRSIIDNLNEVMKIIYNRSAVDEIIALPAPEYPARFSPPRPASGAETDDDER
jgi:hypothetical protein